MNRKNFLKSLLAFCLFPFIPKKKENDEWVHWYAVVKNEGKPDVYIDGEYIPDKELNKNGVMFNDSGKVNWTICGVDDYVTLER